MTKTKRIVLGVIAGLAFLAAAISLPNMVEDLDSSELMVIQSPAGDLTVYTEPGWHYQGFGTVTKYKRRSEFSFVDAACLPKGTQVRPTGGLAIRFYDGGSAMLCGTISWVMPTDPKAIIEIHRDFRSNDAFETQAIRRSMEAAATFSGPTMGSFDSAAGKRNDLLQILNDQTLNGVYRTKSETVRVKDVTGVEKDVSIIKIQTDEKGAPIRAQASYVEKYKVTMLPMTISGFKYEDRVEEQIQQQQKATNDAIISIANAKKADQDALTAEARGRAEATTAEWQQKTLAAKDIATAQSKVTIGEAALKEAELYKKSEILRGEGEAGRKKLVMEADGQLDVRLRAWTEVNLAYANAIQNAKPGAWVPTVNMTGAAGGASGNSAEALIQMMTAKTAKDMGVDFSQLQDQSKVNSAPKAAQPRYQQ